MFCDYAAGQNFFRRREYLEKKVNFAVGKVMRIRKGGASKREAGGSPAQARCCEPH